MDTEAILQQLISIENHLINIEAGLKILTNVAIGFFVWFIIKVLYKLFSGVFFGGL